LRGDISANIGLKTTNYITAALSTGARCGVASWSRFSTAQRAVDARLELKINLWMRIIICLYYKVMC